MDDGKAKNRNFHLRVSLAIIHYSGTFAPEGSYRWLYFIYTAFSFAFLLGIVLLSEIIFLFVHLGDVPKMVAVATMLMTNSAHALKFIILVAREKRLRRLLDITRCEMFNRDNLKYEKIIDSYAWKGIFHHVAYQSFGTVAVLCWGFAPVANLVSGRSRRLPMEGWYPLNVTASPAYEVISMHQGLSVFIACFHNVAIDTFVTGLLTVACCQLKLLQWNLTLVHDDEEQEPPSSNVNKLLVAPRVRRQIIYNKFKKCLEHSNIIYKFTRNIQSTFGTVIFIQLFVNCIIICLIAFHISQMKIYIPSVLIGMLTYMCCMTYQIFIYCWHGNELHLHAMDLALANYSCNWFESTNEFKRALQIMMIRTQRPLRLSAGNIMVLNLNTFMGIIRTSYSIFTVLQSSTNN